MGIIYNQTPVVYFFFHLTLDDLRLKISFHDENIKQTYMQEINSLSTCSNTINYSLYCTATSVAKKMEWLSDFNMYRTSYNPSGNDDIMTFRLSFCAFLKLKLLLATNFICVFVDATTVNDERHEQWFSIFNSNC